MNNWKQIHEQVKELYRIRNEEGTSWNWESLRDRILLEIQTEQDDHPSLLKRIGLSVSNTYRILRDEDALADYVSECLLLFDQHFSGKKQLEDPYDPERVMINTFLNKHLTHYIPREISQSYRKTQLRLASVNAQTCTGCGECRFLCPEEAIEMIMLENRTIAQVISDLCNGCGVCVRVCSPRALFLATTPAVSLEVLTDEALYREEEDDSQGEPQSNPYEIRSTRTPGKEYFNPEHYESDEANEKRLSFIEIALCIPPVFQYAQNRWKKEQKKDKQQHKQLEQLISAKESYDRVLIKKNGYAKGERGERIMSQDIHSHVRETRIKHQGSF